MRVSDLLSKKVVTEDGRGLGRVWDVRVECEREGSYRVTGLVLGRRGLLLRIARRSTEDPHRDALLPWEQLVAVEDERIVARG
jgi:sporulation protein YlmC with PRC-barrel domain